MTATLPTTLPAAADSTSQPPSVELRDVHKTFGGTVAVAGVSLTVAAGEFLTLLGPSGCGKTTTLRMIGGFELPTAGEVLIDGAAMGATPPYRRPVNTVFQQYALFPHLSVGRNVAYGLEMAGVPKAERTRRVAETLELVHLPNVENRRPAELSGGQQQRVALARALVNRPKVLLLDEPLGALDLKLRQAMQLELKRLNREVGATFVYVTHDQEEALTMSDRIAVMNAGRILQLGTPQEIYERPGDRFVAGFIGQTNLLPVTVLAIDRTDSAATATATATVDLAGVGALRARLPAETAPLRPGDRATLAIRPERLALGDDLVPPPTDRNTLSGTLAETIYLGTHNRYLLALPGGHTLTIDRPPRQGGVAEPAPGTLLRATFDPASALLLAD